MNPDRLSANIARTKAANGQALPKFEDFAGHLYANRDNFSDRNVFDSLRYSQFVSQFGSQDRKHKMPWKSYGYPETLTFLDFYDMYRRNPYAKAGVNRTVEKTWETFPELVEDEDHHNQTPWEKKVNAQLKKWRFWHHLKQLDEKQRVGEFGALAFMVRDGEALKDPLYSAGPEDLVKIRTLYQGQLYINTYNYDETDPNYGDPKMFQFIENIPGENSRGKERSVELSPSRLVVWAEGTHTGHIDGIPALEAGFNSLINLEKVLGAGGEGFWLNARSPLNIDFDPKIDINKLATVLGARGPDEIRQKMGELIRKFRLGYDESLMTQGGSVTPIQVTLPNPKEFVDGDLSAFCASISTPTKILVGMQTGERASSEDQVDWNRTNQSRRETFAIPSIEHTIDRMIQIGFIEPPPNGMYHVKWDSLMESTQTEKLEAAKVMSEINKNGMGAEGPVFSNEQMAQVSGFEYKEVEIDDEPEDDIDKGGDE